MSNVEFARRYGPWAVIAGGSEGLGASFAHQLAEHGIKLLLVARKAGPLESLAAAIRSQHGTEVRALSLDLTKSDAGSVIIANTEGLEVGMLIYNAGADTNFHDFIDRPIAESEQMVALNVLTPVRLTRHFGAGMAARKQGGIMIVSSVAGTAGCPGNAVYSASKAFSNVFAEVLWYELAKHGVHVAGLVVGLARTPAMERLGLNFEGPVNVGEPDDLVAEALAHINKGPTLHLGGTDTHANRLRSLPRAEAVRAMAGISTDVQ